MVLHLPELGASGKRPEELIAAFKAHAAIAPLVEGGEVVEYSAHLIPEGGMDMMGELAGDGMLVAGDAASLCLAAGIWLEGVNFAIASGAAAGRARPRRSTEATSPRTASPATGATSRRTSCWPTTSSCATRPT